MGATGTATLNFGAFPGASDASVAVAQPAILAASLVEAWVLPATTADHTSTEHMVETFRVFAADVVAGVGFTIYGFNTSQLTEPVVDLPAADTIVQASATAIGGKNAQPGNIAAAGGTGTLIYGAFNIAWAWF